MHTQYIGDFSAKIELILYVLVRLVSIGFVQRVDLISKARIQTLVERDGNLLRFM